MKQAIADERPSAGVSSVDRFTTIYNADEDRIRILIELSTGDVQDVWLTRRLLGKLVQALLKKLEAGACGAHGSAFSKEAVQSFNQAAAVGGLKRQKAVSAPRQAEGKSEDAVLVTAIGLRWRNRWIELDLKVGEEIKQTLTFDENRLRQWLGIVHSQYKAANWSDDIWPTWVRPQEQSGRNARLN